MAFFHEDIVIRIPGRSCFAREHRGRGRQWTTSGQRDRPPREGHEIEVELVDMLVSDERVALMVRERFGRDEGTLEIRRVNVTGWPGRRSSRSRSSRASSTRWTSSMGGG